MNKSVDFAVQSHHKQRKAKNSRKLLKNCGIWRWYLEHSEQPLLSVGVWISKVKLATLVEGDPKARFSIVPTPRCRRGRYSFLWMTPLYPWSLPYNVNSVKQGGIKYHFLSLWYDPTWDWTSVSWTMGEHSSH